MACDLRWIGATALYRVCAPVHFVLTGCGAGISRSQIRFVGDVLVFLVGVTVLFCP